MQKGRRQKTIMPPDGDPVWAAVRRQWAQRAAAKKRAEEERRALALQKAKAVASHLKIHYGAGQVYLYGSLVWGRHFTAQSDIDLLVEGFPKGSNFWRALVEAEELAAPFAVSLVPAEDASPSLLARATREGVRL
ncbi:MAG: nucleotidyltransferase family protein [Moorellales bacterium]